MGDMGIGKSKRAPAVAESRDVLSLADKIVRGKQKRFKHKDDLDAFISSSLAGEFWKHGRMKEEEPRAVFRFLVLERMLSKSELRSEQVELLHLVRDVVFSDEDMVIPDAPFQDPSDVVHEVFTLLHKMSQRTRQLSQADLHRVKGLLKILTADPVVRDDMDAIYKEFLKSSVSYKAQLDLCIMSLL